MNFLHTTMLHPHIHTCWTHPKLQWAVNFHTFCVKLQWMNGLIAKQTDNNRFTYLKCFTTLSFTLYSISSLSLNQTHFLPTAMTSTVQLWLFLTACTHALAAIIIIAFWENSLGKSCRVNITGGVVSQGVYVNFWWGFMSRFCILWTSCQCREWGRSLVTISGGFKRGMSYRYREIMLNLDPWIDKKRARYDK